MNFQKVTFSWVTFLIVACSIDSMASVNQASVYNLTNEFWTIQVLPERMNLSAKLRDESQPVSVAAPLPQAEVVDQLIATNNVIRWRFPAKDVNVELVLKGTELSVKVNSTTEQLFEWPNTGESGDATALIVPISEGLYLPIRDAFWMNLFATPDCRFTQGGLKLPFWAVQTNQGTLTYLIPDDLRSKVCVGRYGSQLNAHASHRFLSRDGFPSYELTIALTKSTPTSPAQFYRDWLLRAGKFKSLDDKIKDVPEVSNLLGAVHIGVDGDARTRIGIQGLKNLGIDRALLTSDEDPRVNSGLHNAEVISVAKANGYIVSPYDTFDNVDNPEHANSPTSIYDEALYKTGGVMKVDGTRETGFAGHGYYLSSEALKRATTPFFANRVNAGLAKGLNGYFLDVDAAGDLFDDYDPNHFMTYAIDRENRLDRMRFLSEEKKVVLGSESATTWAVPVLHYSDAIETIELDMIWPFFRNKQKFGGYWPPEHPKRTYMEINADSDLVQAGYSPKYRIPLYQTAFHDAIVTRERPELPIFKLKNVIRERILFSLLYNVPSWWILDLKAMKKYGPRLKGLYSFFSPIHRQTGSQPLTDFSWLTPDKLVQKARYSDELEMTANFGLKPFAGVNSLCIEAHWLKTEARKTYCPEPSLYTQGDRGPVWYHSGRSLQKLGRPDGNNKQMDQIISGQ